MSATPSRAWSKSCGGAPELHRREDLDRRLPCSRPATFCPRAAGSSGGRWRRQAGSGAAAGSLSCARRRGGRSRAGRRPGQGAGRLDVASWTFPGRGGGAAARRAAMVCSRNAVHCDVRRFSRPDRCAARPPRLAGHVRGRIARLVERGADPEPGRPGRPPGPIAPGVMPPTGSTARALRQHRQQRPQHRRARPPRPGTASAHRPRRRAAAKASAGVKQPGAASMPARLAAPHQRRVRMRRHHQPAAGRGDLAHLRRGHHRAGADQRPGRRSGRPGGGCSRSARASSAAPPARRCRPRPAPRRSRIASSRLHAAQDGDERQRASGCKPWRSRSMKRLRDQCQAARRRGRRSCSRRRPAAGVEGQRIGAGPGLREPARSMGPLAGAARRGPRAPHGRSAGRRGSCRSPASGSSPISPSARVPNRWCSSPPASRARRTPRRKAASSCGPGSPAGRGCCARSSTARASPVIWVAKPATRPPREPRPFRVGAGQADQSLVRGGVKAGGAAGRWRAERRQQPTSLVSSPRITSGTRRHRGRSGREPGRQSASAKAAARARRRSRPGRRGRRGRAPPASPAGCRPCRRAGRVLAGRQPGADGGAQRGGKPPAGTARMPRLRSRRSRMAPPGSRR